MHIGPDAFWGLAVSQDNNLFIFDHEGDECSQSKLAIKTDELVEFTDRRKIYESGDGCPDITDTRELRASMARSLRRDRIYG